MKKRIIHLIFISTFLGSCGGSFDKQQGEDSGNKAEINLVPFQCKFADLERKVFLMAESRNFEKDSCAFILECDCCYSDIYFNSDKTYFLRDACIEMDSYSYGSYDISGDTLTMNHSGHWAISIYNDVEEADTLSPREFNTDTVKTAWTLKFLTNKCGDKLVLMPLKGEEAVVETKDNYASLIKAMKDQGFSRRLDSMRNASVAH